jgi:response regulator RpfG family c-di-GMP phosphodiesterase
VRGLGERVLIVDDEEMICHVLARRLTKEGYSCTTAHNGKEALVHFCRDTFSIIISDVKMTEMNGIELLKRVKAMNPGVMVVMVTAYPDIDMAVEAVRLGAYDFIIKPVDLDLVVLSVRKASEKRQLQEQLEIYHKNLEKLVDERTSKLQEAYQFLKKAHLDSVKVLVEAIEAKDSYTRGHSDRVRRMSVGIGLRLGFSKMKLENLEYGALLHDIGKIGIRDSVLQKKRELNYSEYQYIKQHPLIGAKILAGIEFFEDKIPMIRNHHENFDGSGYPDRLKGEEIPLGARIIAVSDVFDAMTSLRPHRRAMSPEEVLIEMERGKGKQFDPHLMDIFVKGKIYNLTA